MFQARSLIGPARFATAALLFAACGGGAAVATPTPTPTPTLATASPTTTAAWTVGAASKAVVSVREQLVGVNLPSDAVLTAKGATGTFTLNAGGTFAPGSKISFDLTTLSSDSSNRDSFVKQNTLQTNRFPKAEFTPTKTSGLTTPLAASGSFQFTLTGDLTIHGTTKEVTFDVVAKRNGADLTATATLSPTLKFADFGMTVPSVPLRVLSIVDEIRLVVELVATGAAA